MKKIKYRIMREFVSGADETKIEHRFDEFFSFATEASLPRTLEIISSIAYNGEYTIEDDGEPEPAPTQLDRIEAQTTYTAMMTDTLLEG